MKKYIVYSLIFLFALISCNREVKSEKGRIDIISNVYLNASKNLDNVKSYEVGRINYSNDTIIEIIPNVENPLFTDEIYFIKDSVYYSLGNPTNAGISTITEVVALEKPRSIYTQKYKGAVFSKDKIPNYSNHRQIRDTILFGKKYSRFEVNSPQSFTRYYVYKTDTILPYQIYPHAGKDYKGRIERIDNYDKEKDIFVSLQLMHKKDWDEQAKDVFKFNDFINKKTEK